VAYTDARARQLLAIDGDVGAFIVISSASVYRDHEGRTLDEAHEDGFPDFSWPITEIKPTVKPGSQNLLDAKGRPGANSA
jgi:hypothetical protein